MISASPAQAAETFQLKRLTGKPEKHIRMKIQDGFTIDAPAADVWALLSDPERVADLLPGAKMGDRIDDSTYSGGMFVKVGPLAVAYDGTVSFQLNDSERSVRGARRRPGQARHGHRRDDHDQPGGRAWRHAAPR